MSLAYDAMIFAIDAHKYQRRKYTGNPYFDHLAEVAGITAAVTGPYPKIMAVCWLHDCVEDQGVSLDEIEEQCFQFSTIPSHNSDLFALLGWILAFYEVRGRSPEMMIGKTLRETMAHAIASAENALRVDTRVDTPKLANATD